MKVFGVDEKIKMPLADEEIVFRNDIELPIHMRLVRLTIVCAPEGYGKTMLLSKAFSETKNSTAWLTLDELDNDPIRFWTYVVRSLARVLKTINAEKVLSFIKTSPPHSMIVDTLLNELCNKQEKIALILDDYHIITNPAIHKMMNRFVDYIPHHVKIFIATQNEVPLDVSKWRNKGWLYEIGVQQLQFQLYEIREFYRKRSAGTDHSMSFYQQVLRITEGWPLGIQLFNLRSIEVSQNWEAKDSSIMSPIVAHYLLYEILSRMPSSMQDFLIRTSALNILTPESCNLMLHRTDSEEVLRDIEKRGLFINRLEDRELAYRYHNLFSMALQSELYRRYSKDTITEIYNNAARVQYQAGDYATAIELAIKRKQFSMADEWIEENLVNIVLSKQTEMFMRWVMILRKNSFDVHIETLAVYAFNLAIQFKMEKAGSILRELDRRHEKSNWKNEDTWEDALLILEVIKVFMLFTQYDPTEKRVLFLQKRIREHLFSEESRWKQVTAIYNHFEPQLLRTSIGNRGKLYSIKQLSICNNILRSDKFLAHNLAGYSHGIQAEVYYEMNQLAESEEYIEKAMYYTFRHNDPGLSVPMHILQAKIYLAHKQFVKAQDILRQAIEMTNNKDWQSILLTMKALGYIREGSLERAEYELKKSSNLAHQPAESGFWMLVQARWHMEKGNNRKALYYIDQVEREALEESQITTVIETKILHSICLWQNNKKKQAMNTLHESLELAVKSGYKRLFLDEKAVHPVLISYIKGRLNFDEAEWKTVPLVFAQSLRKDHIVRPETARHINKPKLTPREEQLVKALTTGLSNREIAEQLFLSEGTVRVYLSKVYKKLNVRSRTQAILQVNDWQ